jgi:Glycosyl hydrolase catalytic core
MQSVRSNTRVYRAFAGFIVAGLFGIASIGCGTKVSTLSGTTPSGSSSPGSGSSSNSGSTAGSGTGSGSSSASPSSSPAKSAKRGIAYDLASPADFAALSPGVSWWYNWSPAPNTSVPADYATRYSMDFYPMLWNGSFDANQVTTFLKANPSIKYMLVLNEPNLSDQANMTPQAAAQLWPQYEAIATQTGVKIVGPAITWGTMPGYQDPVTWLDAFYTAYRAANNNRDPQIDYLAFHWYDYGLAGQLDRLTKYQKPFWVTEFANWHSQTDGAQIDTLAKQQAQMMEMVATCESRTDVFRYAWFTGRISPDPHFTSLLGATGQLTGLGVTYLSLPTQ